MNKKRKLKELSGISGDLIADENNGAAYEKVATKEDKLVHKAEKNVSRMVGPRGVNAHTYGRASGLYVELEMVDASGKSLSGGFISAPLITILKEVTAKIPEAIPRLNLRNNMEIYVSTAEQLETARAFRMLAGIQVRPCAQPANDLWGIIIGVMPQISKEELQLHLQPQGVVEVIRETYQVPGNRDIKRSSNRVRIRFEKEITNVVDLGFKTFPVTLYSRPPLQCLACYKYNHKKENCTHRDHPLCGNCGMKGHLFRACRNKPRCINCTGPHPAKDHSCRVYQVWLNAGRRRTEQKLLGSQPQLKVVEEMPMATSSPVKTKDIPKADEIKERDQQPYTWSSVVSRKLVRTTSQGEIEVCRLPKPQPQKTVVKEKNHELKKDIIKRRGDRACCNCKEGVGDLDKLKNVWAVLKPLLIPWLKTQPVLEQVVDLLESGDLFTGSV